MTTLWSYDFEAGVASGTAMTTANSPFKNQVQTGWTFSNTHLLSQGGGSLAGRCAATGATCVAKDDTQPWAATSNIYYRFYLYVEAVPAATTSIMTLWAASNSTQSEFRVLNTGAAQIRNNNFIAVATSPANLLAAGTYARVEVNLNVTNSTQQLKIFTNANVNGSIPDYDSGVVTSAAAAGVVSFVCGVINGTTATFHFDNIVFSNSGWVGPVAVPNQPPTANAGADQTNIEPWSTVTLTGTASDSDGTIASTSWTQVGGTPVTYTVSGNTATFTAPPTIQGDTGTHKFSATDNSGATTSDTMAVTTLPVTERAVINGAEVPLRFFHVHAAQAINPPSAPQNVKATLTSTSSPYSVSITWTAPASDGGSPITGYTVTRRGNGTHSLASTATSDTFNSITAASPPFTFDVIAVNAAGNSPAGSATTASTAYRFPGDTLPLVTGKLYLGATEHDSDGRAVAAGWEWPGMTPEADTNIAYSITREYDSTIASLTPGTGAMANNFKTHAALGRVCNDSLAIQRAGYTWASAASALNTKGSSLYNTFYNFFAWVEESGPNAPFWFTVSHEPQSKVDNTPGSGMSQGDFADMQVAIRGIMNDYAVAKAGSVSAYKWKHLAFGVIHTGEAWTAGAPKDITGFMTQTNGTAVPLDTFDWYGCDTYQQPVNGTSYTWGRTGVSQWTTMAQKFADWITANKVPGIFPEFGIHNTDGDAGQQMTAFWNKLKTAGYDIVAAILFNDAPDASTGTLGQNGCGRWELTDYINNDPANGSNGGYKTAFENAMKDSANAHYYDVGFPRPSTTIGP